jgi:large subunit ribosomal protein L6
MSRIGKVPVTVPSGVKVSVSGKKLSLQGPLGTLHWSVHDPIGVEVDQSGQRIVLTRQGEERQSRALHGLNRAMIANMIQGVTQGYEKKLEIVGVGYLAAVQGTTLQLRVGFAHEVHKPIPNGLTVTCPDQMHISIKGCDKQQVGQFAAEVRAVRSPEPYKGKGIRYDNETVKRKAGKAVTK